MKESHSLSASPNVDEMVKEEETELIRISFDSFGRVVSESAESPEENVRKVAPSGWLERRKRRSLLQLFIFICIILSI